jgi:hypothetical protein
VVLVTTLLSSAHEALLLHQGLILQRIYLNPLPLHPQPSRHRNDTDARAVSRGNTVGHKRFHQTRSRSAAHCKPGLIPLYWIDQTASTQPATRATLRKMSDVRSPDRRCPALPASLFTRLHTTRPRPKIRPRQHNLLRTRRVFVLCLFIHAIPARRASHRAEAVTLVHRLPPPTEAHQSPPRTPLLILQLPNRTKRSW